MVIPIGKMLDERPEHIVKNSKTIYIYRDIYEFNASALLNCTLRKLQKLNRSGF